jgi:hypothetical protein
MEGFRPLTACAPDAAGDRRERPTVICRRPDAGGRNDGEPHRVDRRDYAVTKAQNERWCRHRREPRDFEDLRIFTFLRRLGSAGRFGRDLERRVRGVISPTTWAACHRGLRRGRARERDLPQARIDSVVDAQSDRPDTREQRRGMMRVVRAAWDDRRSIPDRRVRA